MYTIYVNDSPLRLCAADEVTDHPFSLRYTGSPKFFLQAAGTLEGGKHRQLGIQVVCEDLAQAWQDLRKNYKWIPAAGGAVINDGKLLCIRRLGRWDLPKGKHESGESNAQAALREVQEETGIVDIQLGQELPTTYHTYRTRKGTRVLKPTYWFLMHTTQRDLTPQLEEDITEARWVSAAGLPDILQGMYPSLVDVATTAMRYASPHE